ncbi:serine-rich adhesin for platelets-like isoform X9 [Erythrolamprus reginae]|uniref:serine-rich adhesin for platelets-like isoform X9 n=1 Tax=Erythrolamprus reginae TaxID=121349 RepID=UPI00396CEA77
MDLELKDPDTLKLNTLQLLISYPDGIKFGDFIGAFYQFHHFHPQLSHYGYSSLRDLLHDMRETAIVEGSQSNEPVMKLVNGLNLDGWMDEIVGNGPYSFQKEDSRLKNEERTRKEATTEDAARDLAEVLAAITNLLTEYVSGLKLEKMQSLLLSTSGIDLETFIITKGYKDVLTFLSDQIPNIIIRRRGTLNRYVVQLSKDLTVASVPICSILKIYPDGLTLAKLKEAVKKKCGYDLDVFCYQIGYNDIVSCLEEIPELLIYRNKYRTVRVQLKSDSFCCSSSQSSHSPSFDSEQSTCKSKNANQGASEKKPASFSCNSYRCSSSSSSDSDQSTGTSNHSNQDESEKRPTTFNCSSYQSSYSSSSDSDSTSTSNNSNQDDSEKRLVLSDVMALVTALLSNYKKGLRIWKLQDFLVTDEGISLEKFSIVQGYKDTLEFLEQKMPQLILNYQANRLNTVVIKPQSDLEDISKPVSAINDLSGSDSQKVPASISVVPPEVNKLLYTNQSGPSTMSSNLPSFHEPNNNLSIKTKSSPLFSYVVQSQQSNPCQLSAKSVTKQIASSSHVTTFQPSTVPDELKQQVARILARHPKGMSLFQFRIAYSATFKQHFPVGNASSTKQCLLEMPDIVYMKGNGVQTLLLPVSPDVPPTKPGQPASFKVEDVAAVSNLVFVPPVPVTKPAVRAFDSHSIYTSPLDSPEKPGSKNCCISKNQSVLPAPCQEQEKARTSLPSFSDQLSKEDIPVIPGHSLPWDESLIIPQPSSPRAAVMPVPKPHHSFLQYCQSIRMLENEGNKPFSEYHIQDNPGSMKIMQTNTSHLNGPGPKLRDKPFIPHCSAALPTHSQGTVCSENLPADIKSRFTSSTNSNVYVPSVDSTPVSPVLVKSEIYSPRSTSQSSNSIQPMLPVQPPPCILSTEQRSYNGAIAEFDSFEAQIQSRALQHSLSPDSSAKSSVSSLARNSASFFTPRSQLDDQLQQPTHARHDDLQSISASLADKCLRKTSLDRVSPVAMYRRKSTFANSLETSSTTEAFIACSVSGSLHTSSVNVSNSSVSSRAVSPASSPLDFTANSYDQIAYASSEITGNSSALFSETQFYVQQREYDKAAATVISSTETSSTSLLLESTTSSHHQLAYASSPLFSEAPVYTQQVEYDRAASAVASNTETSSTSLFQESTSCSHHQFAYASTNSIALSSETYASGTEHQEQNIQASENIIASTSSISSLDSTTSSLPCQHAYASAEATSNSNVLSKSTACHTPNANFKTNHDPPSQNNLTSPLSEQGNQSASLGEEKVSVISKLYNGCLIL